MGSNKKMVCEKEINRSLTFLIRYVLNI
jgi:hypothetical protein